MWKFLFCWVPKHREPDDVDPKAMLLGLPPRPKAVWIRCTDGEVLGPCPVKFFKSGQIIAKPISEWKEIYPDGTGSSYIKEWWGDDED